MSTRNRNKKQNNKKSNKSIKRNTKQQYSKSSSKKFDTTILLGGIITLAITFMCFFNTTENEFVNWDDDKNFYENELITNINDENFWDNTKKIFNPRTRVIGNYNPLTTWSFAIEKRAYGFDNPGKWHLTNVLLHLLCVFFVYRICLSLGLKIYGAVFVALLFGIHPMRVESVAWVTERKDVLFGVFYLSALFTYIKGKLSNKNYWYFIIPLFILSLLSKIQAVSLPLSMIAVDYYLRGKVDLKSILEKVPYFALSLLIGVIGILALEGQGSLEANETYPIWQRIFIGSYSFIIYLVKAVVPYQLSPLYPYPSTMPIYFYPTILVAPLFVFGMWKAYKSENRVWFFGLAFFTVNIIFLLQILGAGQGFIADRFTYIAYFGLFFIAGYYLDTVIEFEKWRIPSMAIASILILVFGFMTTRQNMHWKNSGTLWTKVLQHYENTVLPYGNRANYYREVGKIDLALKDYSEAIRLKPDNAQAYNSRARLYFDIGKTTDELMQALSDYNKAIEYEPLDGEFYVNRGATYARLNNIDAALNDMNKGLQLKPNHAVGYLNRSVMYNAKGDFSNALKDIESYLSLKPYNADMWYQKGRALTGLNRVNESIDAYKRAIQLNGTKGLYYYEKARALDFLGRTSEAQVDLQKAILNRYEAVDPAFRAKLLGQ